jgi:hypothetical protein
LGHFRHFTADPESPAFIGPLIIPISKEREIKKQKDTIKANQLPAHVDIDRKTDHPFLPLCGQLRGRMCTEVDPETPWSLDVVKRVTESTSKKKKKK